MDFTELFKHTGPIIFSPNGQLIAHVIGKGSNQRVVVRDTDGLQVVHLFDKILPVDQIGFSNDSEFIFIANHQQDTVKIYGLTRENDQYWEATLVHQDLQFVLWSPTGHSLMCWDEFGLQISIYSLSSTIPYASATISRPKLIGQMSTTEAMTPEGKIVLLAILEHDTTDLISIYDVSSQDPSQWHRLRHFTPSPVKDANGLQWSADGGTLAVWDNVLEHRLALFTPLGQLLHVQEMSRLGISHCTFASSQLFAVCDVDYIGSEHAICHILGYDTPLKPQPRPSSWSGRFSIGVGKQWTQIQDSDIPTYQESMGNSMLEPFTDRPFLLPPLMLSSDLAKSPTPLQHGISHLLTSPGTPSSLGNRNNLFIALVTHERPNVLSIWQLSGPCQSSDADVYLWPNPKCVGVMVHAKSISALSWRPMTPMYLVNRSTVETHGWLPDRLTWTCHGQDMLWSWEWREQLAMDPDGEQIRMEGYGVVEGVTIPTSEFTPHLLKWSLAPHYIPHPVPLQAKDDSETTILGTYARPLIMSDGKMWCLAWNIADEQDAALEQQVDMMHQGEYASSMDIEAEGFEQFEQDFENIEQVEELMTSLHDLNMDSRRSSFADSIYGAYFETSPKKSPAKTPKNSSPIFKSNSPRRPLTSIQLFNDDDDPFDVPPAPISRIM